MLRKGILLMLLVFPLLLSFLANNEPANDFNPKTFIPDTSVNGIALLHWKSIITHFEEDTDFVSKRLYRHRDLDFPYADFTNSTETERLQLFTHPGYGLHEFAIAEIRVKSANEMACRGCVKFPDGKYISSRGIYIGMTENELLKKLGEPRKKSTYEGALIFNYWILNTESRFLSRYNHEKWFGDYYFKNGILCQYHIGFDTY
jgi:hypothetical protein